MNIILIFVPALLENKVFEKMYSPPMSIYLLATIAKKYGNNVSIIDPCEFMKFEFEDDFIDRCGEYIAEKASDKEAIAFSSNSFNWGMTKKMIEYLRSHGCKSPIILGGLHPTIFDRYILETIDVTYILRGEGEMTFPLLLSKIEARECLTQIPGLSYRKDGIIVRNQDVEMLSKKILTNYPTPDYSLIPDENTYSQIPVESSRGCPFCCCFCSIPQRHRWASFEPEVVEKRVKEAIASIKNMQYNDYILFVDDCFTIDSERAKSILNLLYSDYHGLKKVFIEARISNIIGSDIFQNINPDVLFGIQIGVECGYDEGLKNVNKQLTIEELYRGLDIMENHGLISKCMLSFILGFPWETEVEIAKTLKTVEDISRKYDVFCSVNWLIYLPSTLWERKNEDGIYINEEVFDDPLWLIDPVVFFKVHPKITIKTVEWVTNLCAEFREEKLNIAYNSPFYISECC